MKTSIETARDILAEVGYLKKSQLFKTLSYMEKKNRAIVNPLIKKDIKDKVMTVVDDKYVTCDPLREVDEQLLICYDKVLMDINDIKITSLMADPVFPVKLAYIDEKDRDTGIYKGRTNLIYIDSNNFDQVILPAKTIIKNKLKSIHSKYIFVTPEVGTLKKLLNYAEDNGFNFRVYVTLIEDIGNGKTKIRNIESKR